MSQDLNFSFTLFGVWIKKFFLFECFLSYLRRGHSQSFLNASQLHSILTLLWASVVVQNNNVPKMLLLLSRVSCVRLCATSYASMCLLVRHGSLFTRVWVSQGQIFSFLHLLSVPGMPPQCRACRRYRVTLCWKHLFINPNGYFLHKSLVGNQNLSFSRENKKNGRPY